MEAYLVEKNFVAGVCILTFSFLSIKYVGLQNLIQRNEQLYGSGNTPSGGVALPFILVQVSFFSLLSLAMSFSILRNRF